MVNEVALRNNELEEILIRRDREHHNLYKDVKDAQEENQLLLEEEEELLDARDKMR
jgi:hypothetical protein